MPIDSDRHVTIVSPVMALAHQAMNRSHQLCPIGTLLSRHE